MQVSFEQSLLIFIAYAGIEPGIYPVRDIRTAARRTCDGLRELHSVQFCKGSAAYSLAGILISDADLQDIAQLFRLLGDLGLEVKCQRIVVVDAHREILRDFVSRHHIAHIESLVVRCVSFVKLKRRRIPAPRCGRHDHKTRAAQHEQHAEDTDNTP